MTAPVPIRPLQAGDVAPLARALAPLPLMQRYGRAEAALARDLEAALARGDGLVTALGPGGVPAGLAWFLPTGTLGMGAYLRLIAVAPGHEGRGVGAALLEAYERAAAVAGKHAFLLVSDFNEGAQRFYERHGWTRSGQLPGLVLPDVTELLYWKRLR
ncbi:MAG: GNAT family N-acetyltransferase [Anaeromyxobacteraceae bacterium]